MKIKGVFFAAILATVLCISGHVLAVLSGSGTEASPYLIQSRADFDEFANPANAALYWAIGIHTKLMCDPNLADTTYTQSPIAPDTNSSTSGFQGTQFTGVFDGNGHTISNLTINQPTKDYIGLFGYVGTNGQVKNLVVHADITGHYRVGGLVGNNCGSITSCYAAGTVTGSQYVGGLAGDNSGGSITSCYATSLVTGTNQYTYVGGLVGYNYVGSITSCYATGSVTGRHYVGGLVGYHYSGLLTSCYATGMVTGTGYNYVGGLVGVNYEGFIASCYATGTVTGTQSVGGLAGYNGRSITTCYATGAVNGTHNIGGLVGQNGGFIISCHATGTVTGTQYYVGGLAGSNVGPITSCYATGEVTGSGDYVGGLAGSNGGPITSCYATGAVTGTNYVGGLVGKNNQGSITSCFWDKQTSGQTTSAGGIGKTTDQMKTLSTFIDAGWDFIGESDNGLNDYWRMEAGDYPRFTVHTWTLAGEGTADTPYIIADTSDLAKIWLRPSACYRLVGGLDLTGISWSSVVIPSFTGIFDGNGFVISNLTINQPIVDYIGLFGFLNTGGQIKNLGVNGTLTGGYYVGGLVGQNYGTISSCYATGAVAGADDVGGLVGRFYGTISSCYATGAVTGTNYVGGLVGHNGGSITSCYATGAVTGMSDVGGLAGNISYRGFITSCFWDIQTSGTSDGVGNINPDPAGAMGKTTAEMKTLSTFTSAGWDFSSDDGSAAAWMMLRENEDYLRLAWQEIFTGDIAGLYGVDMADLMEVVNNWLQQGCPAGCDQADIDNSGTVDLADLSILAAKCMVGG